MHHPSESYIARAREHHIPVASEATWQYLRDCLHYDKPRVVLEIGAAIGSTTCRIAKEIAQWNGKIYAYEISYPSYRRACWRRNQQQCRNAHLLHADILTHPLQERCDLPFDFVFIDGMKMQYGAYLQLIRPYCRTGAHIICDDIGIYADKMDTLRTVLRQEHLSMTKVDLTDGDSLGVIVVP